MHARHIGVQLRTGRHLLLDSDVLPAARTAPPTRPPSGVWEGKRSFGSALPPARSRVSGIRQLFEIKKKTKIHVLPDETYPQSTDTYLCVANDLSCTTGIETRDVDELQIR